jgi:uncharacterized Zn finger protein
MAWIYDIFPGSKPRKADGGIKAQSRRGAFGQNWWSKRWIEVISGFGLGARLTRGRSYARSGQVLSVEIGVGAITAKVQGSRAKPYEVIVQVKTLTEKQWDKVAQTLSREAGFAATLYSGQMPESMETVFRKAGVSLFPSRYADLKTQCSCPDWSNPCKHIAAVYFLVAEEFDRDPFLIFMLRGMTRDALLERVHGGEPQEIVGEETNDGQALQPQTPETALPVDPGLFWGSGKKVHVKGEVSVPAITAALPKRLGTFPFWRGQEEFLPTLEAIYESASSKGLETFLEVKDCP